MQITLTSSELEARIARQEEQHRIDEMTRSGCDFAEVVPQFLAALENENYTTLAALEDDMQFFFRTVAVRFARSTYRESNWQAAYDFVRELERGTSSGLRKRVIEAVQKNA